MRPSDQLIPPPSRPMSELLRMGEAHLRRLRLRRRIQAGIAIGLVVPLVAMSAPSLLRRGIVGDFREITPAERPDEVEREQGRPRTDDADEAVRPRGAGRVDRDAPRSGAGGAPSGDRRRVAGEQLIAFASFRDDNQGSSIYTMRPDGSNVLRVTTGSESDSRPAWSPDGERIAFTSGAYRPADGKHDIFLATPDGTDVDRLTATEEHETDPVWAPDGRSLVVSRATFEGDDTSDLVLIDVATGRSHKLTDTPQVDEWGADWSPDGERIVFQRIDWSSAEEFEHGIYSIEADGSGLRRLTSAWDVDPRWSPDGRSIAFSRFTNLGGAAPGGINTTPAESASIYVIDADGSDVRRVTSHDSVIDYGPSWSPDGDEIVFTRDPDGSESAHVMSEWATGQRTGPLSSLYVVRSNGSDVRQLTDPAKGDLEPAWSG